MNWVDAAILGVIAISALLALLRGFVREVLGIGAWIGAGAAALWGGPRLLPKLQSWISDPTLAKVVAYAAVFLGALILLSVVAGMIGGLVRGSPLGGLDRTLGLAFGVARGAVVVAVAYIGLGWVEPDPATWPEPIQQSRSLPYAYQGATRLVGLLPAGLMPTGFLPKPPPPPSPPTAKAEELLQAQPPPQARASAQP